MPELPEVETVRASLVDRVRGRRIVELRTGAFEGVLGPLGVDATRAGVLGRTILDVARRGKYLVVALDDGTGLLIHLRMTGRLQLEPGGRPPLRFEHLAILLDNGDELRYADQRKFGRVLHVTPETIASLDGKLGPEPLDEGFTSGWIADRMRRRTGRLKSVLLDQRVVAGLGNIYADEALFRAGLHPERKASSLGAEEVERLHAAIVDVLREGIDNRGTTFSSFADGHGASGTNQQYLHVYGRGRSGSPCTRCGQPLSVVVVGGRSSHHCGSCQPIDQ
jgi:formamidopyrimidine-DNA glycosylase